MVIFLDNYGYSIAVARTMDQFFYYLDRKYSYIVRGEIYEHDSIKGSFIAINTILKHQLRKEYESCIDTA